MPEPYDVPIRDDSIRLGQFLKLANLVDSGAEAKPLIQAGVVRVNGEVETRRGRRLVRGDVVTLGPQAARVAAAGGADGVADSGTDSGTDRGAGDGLPW